MKISKLKRLGVCAMCEKSTQVTFVDKIVGDVRLFVQTVVFVMLVCGIGVKFPEIIGK